MNYKRKRSQPVFGIGTNDADYPVNITANIDGKNKIIWRCPFYRAWKGMLERCYCKNKNKRYRNYIGCSVTQEWHSFSKFRAWMVTKDHEGKELDKDLLVHSNKIYGPDLCEFLSSPLNNFLTDSAATRGEWPIGVSWHKWRGKFIAQCRNPFNKKREVLGYFDCPHKAHEAWRLRKHEHACRYADQQSDPRIAQALIQRYAKQVNPEAEVA